MTAPPVTCVANALGRFVPTAVSTNASRPRRVTHPASLPSNRHRSEQIVDI